jgi:uncharacterized membrane protein
MRIGNRQLKYFWKQLYIFMVMLIVVESYFAYFLENSEYSALAGGYYGLMLSGFVLLIIFLRVRLSFAFNHSKPHVSLITGWFLFVKKQRIFETLRDAIWNYRILY